MKSKMLAKKTEQVAFPRGLGNLGKQARSGFAEEPIVAPRSYTW